MAATSQSLLRREILHEGAITSAAPDQQGQKGEQACLSSYSLPERRWRLSAAC